jgi:hypothetical protein
VASLRWVPMTSIQRIVMWQYATAWCTHQNDQCYNGVKTSQGMSLLQFKDFFSDTDSDYDVNCNAEMSWLSRSRLLKFLYNLKV